MMKARWGRQFALVSFVVGCSAEEPVCRIVSAREALTNGAARAHYLKLHPREELAIVQVLLTFSAVAAEESCSGVVIANDLVLTARHCAHDLDPTTITIVFGSDVDSANGRVTARVAALHPERDVMLLKLVEPVDSPNVFPLAVARSAPAGFGEGALVQVAGVGEDAQGVRGHRAFLVEEVHAMDEQEIHVSADGLGGACFGDSGGPLLVRGDDGSVQVLGILASGEANCFGIDRFTRLDPLVAWLQAEAPDRVGGAFPEAGTELGEDGRCFGETAIWFDETGLHAIACPEAQPCGWSEAERGYRCVERETDPCAGVDDVGRCADGNALRCARGRLDVERCSSCGLGCERSPMTGSPICLE